MLSYIQIFFANFAKNGQKRQKWAKNAKKGQILSSCGPVDFKIAYLYEFWVPDEVKSSGKNLNSIFFENKKIFGSCTPQMNIYKFIAFFKGQKRQFLAF